MLKLRNQKGAVTLLVLITVLFFLALLMSSYIIIANKAQTQMERTAEVKSIYEQEVAEEVYKNYIGSDVVPIYTEDQLNSMGTGQNIQIKEHDGRYYTFLPTSTYVLMSDLYFEYTQGWIPIGNRYDATYTGNSLNPKLTGRFEGNGKTITVPGNEDWGELPYEFNMGNSYKYVETGEVKEPTVETATMFSKANGVIEILWLDTNNNVIEHPEIITNAELGGLNLVEWTNLTGGVENIVAVNSINWASYYTPQTGANDGQNTKWANAKAVSGTDEAYFVWIPRYAYRIVYFDTATNRDNYRANPVVNPVGLVGYSTNYGFVNSNKELITGTEPTNVTGEVQTKGYKDYIPHPAFEFGTAKKGIWVGKYEMSKNTTSGNITIMPNKDSLRSQTVNQFYQAGLGVDTTYSLSGDSHMMKNVEWGAAAYLTESKYGRNGTEITINSSGYITGGASGNITTNKAQSTTGNETGIYDMNGTSWEYSMGVINKTVGSSGLTMSSIDAKYYDNYTAYNGSIKGDAVFETSTSSSGSTSWHADHSYFVYSSSPWFLRGGYCNDGSSSGAFGFGCNTRWQQQSQQFSCSYNSLN